MARESLNLLRVLSVFMEDTDAQLYGLELCARAGVKPGNLYPALASLEKRGWVESEWEDIDESKEKRRKRRYYTLTPNGAVGARAMLEETIKPISKRLGWL